MKRTVAYLSLSVFVIVAASVMVFSSLQQQDQCMKNCTTRLQDCKRAANANQSQCQQDFETCRDGCKTEQGNTNTNTNGNMNTNGNTNMNTNGNMNNNGNTNINGNTNSAGNMNSNGNTNDNRPGVRRGRNPDPGTPRGPVNKNTNGNSNGNTNNTNGNINVSF
jgi:hypothetical protein